MVSRPEGIQDLGSLVESQSVLRTLAELMGVSQFLWEDFLRMQHESLFPILMDVPALDEQKSRQELDDELAKQLASQAPHDGRVRVLNDFKDREMFRIDLRHITRRIDWREFSNELTALAEVVVGKAAELAHMGLQKRYRTPILDGRRCLWSISALGKFGGRELGFASDIELIFVYEGEGAADGEHAVPNSRYFEEFAHEFVSILQTRREGIFEIDLRLRPHGSAGAFATSLSGLRSYYADSGDAQQFERMAPRQAAPGCGRSTLHRLRPLEMPTSIRDGNSISRTSHLRHRQATELVPLERSTPNTPPRPR
jgi:glutamate-ammonia-ligase adenylyltransferase